MFLGALLLAVRRSVDRGRHDSTELDLRIAGNDSEPRMPVVTSTMAGVCATDQFVEHLPSMTKARARVQFTRKVSDRYLKLLFGNVDEPAFSIDSYLSGYDKITTSLRILKLAERRSILAIRGILAVSEWQGQRFARGISPESSRLRIKAPSQCSHIRIGLG